MAMNSIETVSVDLGKNTFHAIAYDDRGRELHRKLLSRTAVIKYFANLEPCVVAMEACGGSHFLAREIARFGHTPRLMAAQHVRPYVKSNKTDFGDAGAIYSASQNSDMRFVAPKTEAQQALATLNVVREAFVKDRSATVNRIHGLLLEMGVALTPSFKSIRTLPVLLDDCTFSPLVKAVLRELHGHFNYLSGKLDQLNKELERQVAGDDLATRLMTIPCIGPITSSALAAELGDGKQFKCGRDYSASIGLVPRQFSTGGQTKLLGISKRGDRNQRRLLVLCSRAYLIHLDRQKGALADWVRDLLTRHHSNHVVCALANKLGRIAWAIAAKHTEFDAGPAAMNA
jgi:transposase